MTVKTTLKTESVETVLSTTPKKPIKIDEKDRQAALKSIPEFRRAIAWEVHRRPLTKYIVDSRTRVHLPRGYIGRNRTVRAVLAGTDLNQFVHNHYMELVDIATLPNNEANFVSDVNILAKR